MYRFKDKNQGSRFLILKDYEKFVLQVELFCNPRECSTKGVRLSRQVLLRLLQSALEKPRTEVGHGGCGVFEKLGLNNIDLSFLVKSGEVDSECDVVLSPLLENSDTLGFGDNSGYRGVLEEVVTKFKSPSEQSRECLNNMENSAVLVGLVQTVIKKEEGIKIICEAGDSHVSLPSNVMNIGRKTDPQEVYRSFFHELSHLVCPGCSEPVVREMAFCIQGKAPSEGGKERVRRAESLLASSAARDARTVDVNVNTKIDVSPSDLKLGAPPGKMESFESYSPERIVREERTPGTAPFVAKKADEIANLVLERIPPEIVTQVAGASISPIGFGGPLSLSGSSKKAIPGAYTMGSQSSVRPLPNFLPPRRGTEVEQSFGEKPGVESPPVASLAEQARGPDQTNSLTALPPNPVSIAAGDIEPTTGNEGTLSKSSARNINDSRVISGGTSVGGSSSSSRGPASSAPFVRVGGVGSEFSKLKGPVQKVVRNVLEGRTPSENELKVLLDFDSRITVIETGQRFGSSEPVTDIAVSRKNQTIRIDKGT